MDLEDFVTELVPVAEWEWWLWRVTWSNDRGQTLVQWCVNTDTHVEGEVQHRWPSDHWTWAVWEPVETCSAPKTLWCPALRREYPEDAWTAGERVAKQKGLI
jgi:hypothetical protein